MSVVAGSENVAKTTSPDVLLTRRAHLSGGQPISQLMAQAIAYPNLISLAAGFVDAATLPVSETEDIVRRMLADPALGRRALQYGTTAGSELLRKEIIGWSYRPWPEMRVPDVEQVVVTAGSNQLLHLVSEAILEAGDIVLCAAPTYFVYLGTLRNLGVRAIGVEADENGICPQALAKTLDELTANGERSRVKAIYLVPYFDNPGGTTLSVDRRQQVLDMVLQEAESDHPIALISDNAYQPLGFEESSLPPFLAMDPAASDWVVEAGTFSKSFSPGIRVGWGVLPPWLATAVKQIKGNIDFGSPHFCQEIVYEALRTGTIDSHLKTIRAAYHEKCAAMLTALDSHLSNQPGVSWHVPNGGLYVWLTVPQGIDTSIESELWQLATTAGVLYVPGEFCFPGEGFPVQRNTMRLTFGVQTPERIASGIELLAKAIKQRLGSE